MVIDPSLEAAYQQTQSLLWSRVPCTNPIHSVCRKPAVWECISTISHSSQHFMSSLLLFYVGWDLKSPAPQSVSDGNQLELDLSSFVAHLQLHKYLAQPTQNDSMVRPHWQTLCLPNQWVRIPPEWLFGELKMGMICSSPTGLVVR